MPFEGKPVNGDSNTAGAVTKGAASAPAVGTASDVGASAGPAPTTILVIEDDPRSARMVSAHLQSAGYRVTIAYSGGEAQESVRQGFPDLILCDVCLPDLDGIAFTRWMRATFTGVDVPIALVTSSDDSKILARGLEAGADDFLGKPVNSLELRTRVRSLLRSKLLADELRAREQAALPIAGDGQVTTAARVEVPADGANQITSAVIIEDNAQERRLLEAHLGELHCLTRGANGAESGLALLRESVPDLIVLDLLLPDRSGYEFISAVKGDPRLAQVPILVVSGMSEVPDRVKALELGADDYVVKGFERLEFEARVRRLLRLKKSLDQLSTRCDQALKAAATDSLTGLFTRGFMQKTLQGQFSCAQRYGQFYSVIFADLDHFKQINDQHGHAAGDAVLRAVAKVLSQTVRQADTLVRYGGEEFVTLLPHTARADAVQLAERMRAAVAAIEVPLDEQKSLRVTMSLGVASYPDDASDAAMLVERGDDAMYLAKQSGRNQVVAWGSTSTSHSDGTRVLLVDDDEKNIRLLEAFLAPEGYKLLRAGDGLEAIEVCRAQNPDVIIMDGLMPKLSGYEACRRLKQDPKTQLLPVVLVTALDARQDKLRGIEAGADDFITKPVDKVELLSRIRALVRQKRSTDALEDAEAVVFALARAVEGRDPMLKDHVERVSHFAVGLGRALGLADRDLIALRRAGMVHDIGKIAIPDPILFKRDKLTPEETRIIQQHPETGHKLLEPLRTFSDSLPAVRFHHERLDGSGYPLGLRGAEIPLFAQIIAIADVFDALSAPRCYRGAMTLAESFGILRDEAQRGLHDPQLVETFITQVASRPQTLPVEAAELPAPKDQLPAACGAP